LRRTLTPEQAEERIRILEIVQDRLPQDEFDRSRSYRELTQLAEVLTKDEVQFTVKIVRKEPDQHYFIEFLPTPEQARRRKIDTLVEKSRSLSTLFAFPKYVSTENYKEEMTFLNSRIIRSFVEPEEELRWLQSATFSTQNSAVFQDIIANLKILSAIRVTVFLLMSSLKAKDAKIGVFLLELIRIGEASYYHRLRRQLGDFCSRISYYIRNITPLVDYLVLMIRNADSQSHSMSEIPIDQEMKMRNCHLTGNRRNWSWQNVLSSTNHYQWWHHHTILKRRWNEIKHSVQIWGESDSYAAAVGIFHFLGSEQESLMSKIRFQYDWTQREIRHTPYQTIHSSEVVSVLEHLLDHIVKIHGLMGQLLLQKEAIDKVELEELSVLEEFSAAIQEPLVGGALYHESLKRHLNAKTLELSQGRLFSCYRDLLPSSPSSLAFLSGFTEYQEFDRLRENAFSGLSRKLSPRKPIFDDLFSREEKLGEIWTENSRRLSRVDSILQYSILGTQSTIWGNDLGDFGVPPALPSPILEFVNARMENYANGDPPITSHNLWQPLTGCSDFSNIYLVHIPQTVNGERYSLDLLAQLIQNGRRGRSRLKGNWRQYASGDFVEKSYWVLILSTRQEDKSLVEQRSWIASQKSIGRVRAEIPTMLEVATVNKLKGNGFADVRCQAGKNSDQIVGWKAVNRDEHGNYVNDIEFLSPSEANTANWKNLVGVWRFLDG
jgi:hypothetical protein